MLFITAPTTRRGKLNGTKTIWAPLVLYKCLINRIWPHIQTFLTHLFFCCCCPVRTSFFMPESIHILFFFLSLCPKKKMLTIAQTHVCFRCYKYRILNEQWAKRARQELFWNPKMERQNKKIKTKRFTFVQYDFTFFST